MKNFKLFAAAAIFAVGALTITSCEKTTPDGEELPTVPVSGVVDFEAATLGEGNIMTGSYTEDGLTFVQNPSEYGPNGFFASNNHDVTTAGFANQYSACDAAGGKFGLGMLFGETAFKFDGSVVRVIDNADFVNSTYAYLAVKDGNDGNETPYVKGPFADGDWFLLTATGYDAAGTKTGTKEIYLADFRDGKSEIFSTWTNVDLSSLGAVNKVSFVLTSSDAGEFGMNTPNYFCIDNVKFSAKK